MFAPNMTTALLQKVKSAFSYWHDKKLFVNIFKTDLFLSKIHLPKLIINEKM